MHRIIENPRQIRMHLCLLDCRGRCPHQPTPGVLSKIKRCEFRTPVIKAQDRPIVEAEAGDGVCAVLAHADAVAVAEDVEAERAILVQKRKARGVQPEGLSQLNAGE